jgi:DNA-binding transcriptional LysR family regulator
MPRFDWDDLRAFLAMARAGRLTVAARQMGVDHSTLSRRIAALEHAIGVRLFDRRAVGFVLTPEGERLMTEAEAMETLAVRIGANDASRPGGITGTVRLGTPEGFGTYFLGPRLGALGAAHPELAIELVANPRVFSLSKREADLAVAMSRPAQGRLSAAKVVDYELGIFAAPEYLTRHGDISAKPDLERQRWIGYVEDLMWTPELDYLPHILPTLTPHLRISNVISQLEAIAGGVAIGVLPCFIARTRPRLIRILPEEIRLVRSYWLISHAESKDLARIRLLSDFILREARALGAAFWM